MIVRPMHVHQPLAKGTQRGQCGGGTIDKLPVGSGLVKSTFQHELTILRRLKAIFIQESGYIPPDPGDIKNSLHRAGITATPY